MMCLTVVCGCGDELGEEPQVSKDLVVVARKSLQLQGDGQEAELGRVDYVLRALTVSPGQHKVELSFFPKSLDVTESVAYASLGMLLLLIILAVFLTYKRGKNPLTRSE